MDIGILGGIYCFRLEEFKRENVAERDCGIIRSLLVNRAKN
jgi:hypothetical protein